MASPYGMSDVPVLERERRKNDKIDHGHGLLPIAMDCLHYQENERPSSEELCERLAGLKESREYRESKEQVEREQNDIAELERQIGEMEVRERATVQQLRGETQSKEEQLQTAVRENRRLHQEHTEQEGHLRSRNEQLQRLNQQLGEREGHLRSRNEQLNRQLEEQEQVTAEIQRANHSLQRQVEQLQQQLSQQNQKPSQLPSAVAVEAQASGRQLQQHHSMKEKRSQPSPQEDPLTDHEATVVTIPQPDLSGATEQMNAEAVQRRLDEKASELRNDPSLTDQEREMILEEEKMRIGIEKTKFAHKRRAAIKVFNPDRSNKTVVVEEGMTANMVCHLLVNKNHFDESPNWVIVEQLGDVSLERELEDHECIMTVYSSWPRDHNNVFLFKHSEKKYDLFEDPIKYFPDNLKQSQAANVSQSTLQRMEKTRQILLQEYFSSTSRVPELEGFLNLKDGYNYKKSWKKVYIILRASGLYYSTKGKSKTAKHLVLLCHFDEYKLYHGINFKKTLKAPTEFCFALRPIPKAVVPLPKDIKVICCDDEQTALSWTAGIRLAKYGLQLRDNFYKAKMTQFKLEDLAAPEGSQPNADKRASRLVGLRLEKHLDKVREQYKQQKEEEELRRMLYRSPHLFDVSDEEESTDMSVGTSEHSGRVPSLGGSPITPPQKSLPSPTNQHQCL